MARGPGRPARRCVRPTSPHPQNKAVQRQPWRLIVMGLFSAEASIAVVHLCQSGCAGFATSSASEAAQSD